MINGSAKDDAELIMPSYGSEDESESDIGTQSH